MSAFKKATVQESCEKGLKTIIRNTNEVCSDLCTTCIRILTGKNFPLKKKKIKISRRTVSLADLKFFEIVIHSLFSSSVSRSF